MEDLLRMDHINSLPQPFIARLWGDDEWPVEFICVETGCMRIDVVGKGQNMHIGDVKCFIDVDGEEHDTETFYTDFIDPPPN